MAVNRLVIDIHTAEPLTDTRLRTLARETSDWLHTIAVEKEDEVDPSEERTYAGHVHQGEKSVCSPCAEHAQDRMQ